MKIYSTYLPKYRWFKHHTHSHCNNAIMMQYSMHWCRLAVQLQTQLRCITQLSDWAELESRIPNKFTTEFFSTHDHVHVWSSGAIIVYFEHFKSFLSDLTTICLQSKKSYPLQKAARSPTIITTWHIVRFTRYIIDSSLYAYGLEYAFNSITHEVLSTIMTIHSDYRERASVFRTTMHFALHDSGTNGLSPKSGSYNIIKT